VVVALTGTDLYSDLGRSKAAHRSLELAQRLVLLQPAGIQRLPKVQRSKARLIYQSVAAPRRMAPQSRRYFDVCVLAHLRAVKDPFRAAMATRKLADHSRIRILQLGAALTESYAERARAEQEHNPRYLWLGDLPRHVARARLAHSHLMVLSSKMEGGANVIGEAAVAGVPILASRIEGSVGLLGPAHPGFFEVGDTEALRSLLLRSETEPDYYRELKRASRAIAPLFRPEREKRAWRELIREISGRGAGT
jgi:putative glycosyltransferase (TIGR04348 family)